MDYRFIIIYLLLYYYIDSCSSECIALYSEGFLREKLRLAETTRILTLWYDHGPRSPFKAGLHNVHNLTQLSSSIVSFY